VFYPECDTVLERTVSERLLKTRQRRAGNERGDSPANGMDSPDGELESDERNEREEVEEGG